MIQVINLEPFGKGLTKELFTFISEIQIVEKRFANKLWIPKEPDYWSELKKQLTEIMVIDDREGKFDISPAEELSINWFGMKISIEYMEALREGYVLVEYL